MRFFTVILFACLLGQSVVSGQDAANSTVEFHAIDVHIDSGNDRLGGYQIHLKSAQADLKIVSIEGGEHSAFGEAPKYDARAIQRNEVKLAAFTTLPQAELPVGRTRVATLHVVTKGSHPVFAIRKQVAANAGIERIDAMISITIRNKETN